jgi:hypothetical protein
MLPGRYYYNVLIFFSNCSNVEQPFKDNLQVG